MKIFFRILVYVRPYWRTLALSIACTFMFSIFSGASIYLTIPLLETLFDQSPTEINATQTPPRNQLVPNESVGVKQFVEHSIRDFLFAGTKSEALFKICMLIFFVFMMKNMVRERRCKLLYSASMSPSMTTCICRFRCALFGPRSNHFL